MKKKVLSLLLVLGGIISLIFCAVQKSEPSNDNEVPAYEEVVDEPASDYESGEDTDVEEADEKAEVDSEEETEEKNDTNSEEEDGELEVSTGQTDEPSGIVVLHLYNSGSGTNRTMEIAISEVTPGTYESKEISHFSIRCSLEESVSSYYFPSTGNSPQKVILYDSPSITANFRHWFSSDFKKLAVSETFTNNNECHVGWLDHNGRFFDVTEALDETAQSDFEDPRNFFVLGFTQDDIFEYGESFAYNDFDTYYVMPDNLSVCQEGDVFQEKYLAPATDDYDKRKEISWFSNDYLFSDWIDEIRCVASTRKGTYYSNIENEHGTSCIVNTETQEVFEYIPGTTRKNWSGVVSPDGTEIAFLSEPATGTESPSIYTTSVDGGDPVRINCDIDFPRSDDYGRKDRFYLLDWK